MKLIYNHMYLLTPLRERQGRFTEQALDSLVRWATGQSRRMDDRSDIGISLGSPPRAETAHDLAVDHRRSQVAFRDIVGRRHISPMQEDKQALPMFSIAFSQPFFIRMRKSSV
jgi:hypothetical protein